MHSIDNTDGKTLTVYRKFNEVYEGVAYTYYDVLCFRWHVVFLSMCVWNISSLQADVNTFHTSPVIKSTLHNL